jgi:hypothetical protein
VAAVAWVAVVPAVVAQSEVLREYTAEVSARSLGKHGFFLVKKVGWSPFGRKVRCIS